MTINKYIDIFNQIKLAKSIKEKEKILSSNLDTFIYKVLEYLYDDRKFFPASASNPENLFDFLNKLNIGISPGGNNNNNFFYNDILSKKIKLGLPYDILSKYINIYKFKVQYITTYNREISIKNWNKIIVENYNPIAKRIIIEFFNNKIQIKSTNNKIIFPGIGKKMSESLISLKGIDLILEGEIINNEVYLYDIIPYVDFYSYNNFCSCPLYSRKKILKTLLSDIPQNNILKIKTYETLQINDIDLNILKSKYIKKYNSCYTSKKNQNWILIP